VNQVKWLASLLDGRTIEGYIGVGDQESTDWQKLKVLLEQDKGLCVTQLRLQYRGLTLYAIPHADTYACYTAFSLNPAAPCRSYQEQAVLGSKIGEDLYLLRLSQDGQVWQELRQGTDSSCVRGG
jgi:hypothetical protein